MYTHRLISWCYSHSGRLREAITTMAPPQPENSQNNRRLYSRKSAIHDGNERYLQMMQSRCWPDFVVAPPDTTLLVSNSF